MFSEKIEDLNIFENTQNCFAYISVTKYPSEAVLYSKHMAEYPLSPHIKTIAVAYLQAEIFWKQGCYILENSKKHPISGVWYTPMEIVLKAELCFKFVLNGYILWEQGEKNDFVFGQIYRMPRVLLI